MSATSRLGSRTTRMLTCTCLTVLGLAATALAQDWNGTEKVVLGDKATATFAADAPFEAMHNYRFFAPPGTKLKAGVKADKGATLVPGVRLLRNGQIVELGKKLKARGGKADIKNFKLTAGGWYELEVTPASGLGGYKLATKGVFPRKGKATVEDGSFEFDVVGRTIMKLAKLKGPKGSTASFTGLLGPDGAPIPIAANLNKLKKIELPETGTYTLTYSLGVTAKLQPGQAAVQVSLLPTKSKEQHTNAVQGSLPMGMVDAGDPHNGTTAPGYVGTDACRRCHPDEWGGVVNGFHNSKMRNPFREGAAGYAIPPAMEALFKAGTDLKTTQAPTFDSVDGVLAVSYVEGDPLPYKITVGNSTYDVMYVMGGNGPWKQRYVVKIGDSHYITPIQYNDKAQSFSAYHASDWDATGPTAKKNSWERRCGACHATGILLSFDQPSGEYRTGYAQLNVGCEACHGGGAAHVASGSATDILNPRDLLDGTVEGVQKADLTCGQCHHRGGGGKPDGAADGTGYPWKNGTGIFTPGSGEDVFAEFYTTGTGQYFREKDNPLGSDPTPGDRSDDTWLASKKHHQQYLDLHNGPHSPDAIDDGTCFDCHDPHASGSRKHMVAETIERDGNTFRNVENDNNKVCLACHNGGGDFAGVTADAVNAITNDSAPISVVDAVVAHMTDKAAMPIETPQYDPAGDGTGRCSKCHMPKTAKSAVYTTDNAGHRVGDIHSHTFRPVWPIVSEYEDVTNSCEGCHPLDPQDGAADKIAEWVNDADGDETFHADTPRSYQNGVANAESPGGGMACSACHTTEGFISAQVQGDMAALIADADQRADIVRESIKHDAGITCRACHGKQSDGSFAAGKNPLRFPADDLCGKCHMNETVQFADYFAHGEIVRHPQQQMIDAVEGAEVSTFTYSSSFHGNLSCVDCHYDTANGGTHEFEPNLASCEQQFCHQGEGLTDFNRTADGDYDGDGNPEGMQDEVDGALTRLANAILAKGSTNAGVFVTFDGSYWLIDDDADPDDEGDPTPASRSATDLLHAVDDAALARAIFNHYWVRYDGSRGIHNSEYALQLIQQSYVEVTGTDWPGDPKN